MSVTITANADQFARALSRFVAMAYRREVRLYERTFLHTERSVKFGSLVTGAPGQPFKTGNLRDKSIRRSGSFTRQDMTVFADLSIAHYANIIENNARGAQLRSKVGGFHSFKITRLNWRWIVRHELVQTKIEVKM